ncbi:hypothetical protein LIA77_05483 [Sarocladium implicatum]|nr:hypothetical protein LIA77_05483 [Sarocladium implicatum]
MALLHTTQCLILLRVATRNTRTRLSLLSTLLRTGRSVCRVVFDNYHTAERPCTASSPRLLVPVLIQKFPGLDLAFPSGLCPSIIDSIRSDRILTLISPSSHLIQQLPPDL